MRSMNTERLSHDVEYEADTQYLATSLTLPRIEEVLRAEGIRPQNINQQLQKIKDRYRRYEVESTALPNPRTTNEIRLQERFLEMSVDAPMIIRPILKQPTSLGARSATAFHSNSTCNVPVCSKCGSHRSDLTSYMHDIEESRWCSQQQLEKNNLGSSFIAPKIVLIASNVPGSQELAEKIVKKSDSILTVLYKFDIMTYEALIDLLKRKLNHFRDGCKARSVLLCCLGGPGFLYLVKNKVVTAKRLQKPDQPSLLKFWQEFGQLMSKIRPELAKINIIGCDVMGRDGRGRELFRELEQAMHPNIVSFDHLVESIERKRQALMEYVDINKYLKWVTRQRDVLDFDFQHMSQVYHNISLPAIDNG